MTFAGLRNGLTRFQVWMALLAAGTFAGFWAIVSGFLQGHENTFNTSTGVPWGILIAAYVFLVVSSTGMCLVSSLGHVFGMERFKPLGRRAVALAILLLVGGFVVILSDLERPLRIALYLFVTPNPTSAMWWMGVLYGLYFFAMIMEFFFMSRAEVIERTLHGTETVTPLHRAFIIGMHEGTEESVRSSEKYARLAGAAGVIFALAAHSTLGAVFGFIGGRGIWHGPFLPIYFILSAFVSGSAILILSLVLGHRNRGWEPAPEIRDAVQALGRLLLGVLCVFLFFVIWKLMTAQYGQIPGEFEAVMVLVNGPLAMPFWLCEITFGLLVPIGILVYTRGRSRWGLVAAALLVMVGMFFARYDFLIAGQLVPVVGSEILWQYTPHLIEVLSVVGAICLVLLLYSVADRLLPLEDYRVAPGPYVEAEGAQPAPDAIAPVPGSASAGGQS